MAASPSIASAGAAEWIYSHPTGACLFQQRRRNIDPDERVGLRRHQRAAQSRTAAEVEHTPWACIHRIVAQGEMVPGTGIEPVWLAPRDFKSLVSTNFTIRAEAAF